VTKLIILALYLSLCNNLDKSYVRVRRSWLPAPRNVTMPLHRNVASSIVLIDLTAPCKRGCANVCRWANDWTIVQVY